MMAMPQMRPAASRPLEDEPGQVEVTYEGAPSPRELLENIVIQAHAALKGLKPKKRSPEDAKDYGADSIDSLREEAAKRGSLSTRHELADTQKTEVQDVAMLESFW